MCGIAGAYQQVDGEQLTETMGRSLGHAARTNRVPTPMATNESMCSSPTGDFRSSISGTANNAWSSNLSCSATTARCTTIARSRPSWPPAVPASSPRLTPRSSSRPGADGVPDAYEGFGACSPFAVLDQTTGSLFLAHDQFEIKLLHASDTRTGSSSLPS